MYNARDLLLIQSFGAFALTELKPDFKFRNRVTTFYPWIVLKDWVYETHTNGFHLPLYHNSRLGSDHHVVLKLFHVVLFLICGAGN